MNILRRVIIALAIIAIAIALSWYYTNAQLAHAQSDGIYSSAEEGMLALVDQYYPADHEVKILYAGTNSPSGRNPTVWYVIAEVHASSRADGSPMGSNGCDAPGSFFLQTKQGWVHVPETSLPEFIGFWMNIFDLAGEGQSTPSTNWPDGQPNQLCR